MGVVADILDRALTAVLAPRPDILKKGNVLVIRSGWRTWLFSLGARHRRVTVDPQTKVLRIRDRQLWVFFLSRRIEFEWVAEIVMDDTDLTPWNWGTYTQEDVIRIDLRLKNGERVKLFRFFNQGDFVNDSILFPDWCYWEEHVANAIVPGDQMSNIAARVGNVLSGLMGVPFC